jgi:hypothetical protein
MTVFHHCRTAAVSVAAALCIGAPPALAQDKPLHVILPVGPASGVDTSSARWDRR